MTIKKRGQIAVLAVVVAVLALVAVQAIWRPLQRRVVLRSHPAALDVGYPDAIIDSGSLSRLPADIIRVPLLHSLLTRDFVDYYESNPTRMSVEGTLRRLAFEHDLPWRDELLKRVFDEPSRVLLWRTPDGRLGYWLMSMRRNGFAKLLQAVGNVVSDDTQLSQAGSLPGDVPLYALKLAVGRTLLFASKGDQLVVLSSPQLLMDQQGQLIQDRARMVAKLLDGQDAALSASLLDQAPAVADGHRITISANYLSFGYQAFFSGIDAVRFDFGQAHAAPAQAGGESAWSTAALIDPARLPQQWNGEALWQALPANAAACATLPVDWNDAAGLLEKLGPDLAGSAKALHDHLEGPAAVCWYAASTLASPVFVARLTKDAMGNAAFSGAMAQLFDRVIGAYEARAGDSPGYRRLPVQACKASEGVSCWMRPVSARAGTASSRAAPYAEQLSTPRYFPVTLALAHGYAVFSPDARLVDDTLAVLDKRYPSEADTLAPQPARATVAVITPSSLAALAEREAGRTLPADQEAIFRNAARQHLLPKLHAFAAYAPVSLSLPDSPLPSAAGWVPVTWRANAKAGGVPRDDAAMFPPHRSPVDDSGFGDDAAASEN